jgi:hypothetical protein
MRVDHLRYKSSTHQSELIMLDISQLHIRVNWSFKIHVSYTSVRVDHLMYKSNKYQNDLIFLGKSQVHLSDNWSFKIQVTSVIVDQLR